MEKINFLYKFPEDYNPVYVNGAYGGTTPKKEIVINFFLERTPVPRQVVCNLNEDGTLSEMVSITPEDHERNIVRYVSTGVVLSLDTAISIRDWLNGHIERLQEE